MAFDGDPSQWGGAPRYPKTLAVYFSDTTRLLVPIVKKEAHVYMADIIYKRSGNVILDEVLCQYNQVLNNKIYRYPMTVNEGDHRRVVLWFHSDGDDPPSDYDEYIDRKYFSPESGYHGNKPPPSENLHGSKRTDQP